MDAGAHKAFAQRDMGAGSEQPEEPTSAAMDEADLMFAKRGCCCFWIPSFGSGGPSARSPGRGAWERIGGGGAQLGAPAAPSRHGPWWRRAMLKVREWSEIVAGPRWKTFIRRFNRNRRWGGGGGGGRGGCCGIGGGGGGGGGGGARQAKFQYDPLSYALNFDEGPHGGQGGGDDEDYGYRDFSARYVLPPSSAKSSMDLGGRDAPPLFPAT